MDTFIYGCKFGVGLVLGIGVALFVLWVLYLIFDIVTVGLGWRD